MNFRARFAPSPTGQVHIGNIRTAIFNWLFTRHCGGEFLLRIEDTDLERSTKEAIGALLDCMAWLGLDYDGDVMYQSTRRAAHGAAARRLLTAGHAYELEPGAEHSPLLFRLPYDCDAFPFVRTVGEVRIDVAPGSEIAVSRAGLTWRSVTPKGKPADHAAGLAGFKNLKIFAPGGAVLFRLDAAETAQQAEPQKITGAAAFSFVRREVFFRDLVKGELSKPLDSIRDFIIVRGDGSPVFHLANVCDDAAQGVTHIVRGDDHVENTFRHLFLFQTLGFTVPVYAHLPMLVNASGRPYSKRDGDAFVGDFRDKGFLPEALFNYLSLLGWSPGDNREKMSRDELVAAFALERVQRSSARVDMNKLLNLNGQYVAELPFERFELEVWNFAGRWAWRTHASRPRFRRVAALMQSRTKTYMDARTWRYFFTAEVEYDAKAAAKFLARDASVRKALEFLADRFGTREDAAAGDIEAAIREAETRHGIAPGKLNQPLRIALTGAPVGAGVYETAEILGGALCAKRIRRALNQTGT